MIGAKPMTFSGTCEGCGRKRADMPAVEYVADHWADGIGEWICARCARRLAMALLRASGVAAEKVRAGFVQRHERWVHKSKLKDKEKRP